jgi:hypothetical protein
MQLHVAERCQEGTQDLGHEHHDLHHHREQRRWHVDNVSVDRDHRGARRFAHGDDATPREQRLLDHGWAVERRL